MTLAVVRDLREARVAATAEELAAFETDVLAGFVLARAAAGLADGTIAPAAAARTSMTCITLAAGT